MSSIYSCKNKIYTQLRSKQPPPSGQRLPTLNKKKKANV